MRKLAMLVVLTVGCSSTDPNDSSMEPGNVFEQCSDSCQEVSLTAVFGQRTLVFEEAYFGFSAYGDVYVEAYSGGSGACPTEISPTPIATLADTVFAEFIA